MCVENGVSSQFNDTHHPDSWMRAHESVCVCVCDGAIDREEGTSNRGFRKMKKGEEGMKEGKKNQKNTQTRKDKEGGQ